MAAAEAAEAMAAAAETAAAVEAEVAMAEVAEVAAAMAAAGREKGLRVAATELCINIGSGGGGASAGGGVPSRALVATLVEGCKAWARRPCRCRGAIAAGAAQRDAPRG